MITHSAGLAALTFSEPPDLSGVEFDKQAWNWYLIIDLLGALIPSSSQIENSAACPASLRKGLTISSVCEPANFGKSAYRNRWGRLLNTGRMDLHKSNGHNVRQCVL